MNFLELFKKPKLIAAHRGNRSQKPENTLSALASSIGKCDFIEIDVQLTKDLVPVIIHDDTLSRTSDVSKIERFEDRTPWRVSEEQHLYLNVEIKDMSNTFSDEIVVQIIIDMIKKTQTEHLVLLSSFYHHYLPMCKKLSSKIPTAALQMYKHPHKLIDYLHTLQVNAYHPEDKITNKKIVADLKEAGFFINVFVVNKPRRQKKLFEWGVNGIFIDNLA
jgi:glycerophosphoryl diester phosphodiesterase